jgi:D-alanyl-D-alanine carboxypeptidase
MMPFLLLAQLAASGPPPAADARAGRLDSVVRSFHAGNRFDGVVLVSRGDTVLYRAAFGSADHERHVPLQAGSIFPICSFTKQFTAALVMRLVERGRLSLDAPVQTWLPELGRDAAGQLTLTRLLSHTSNLPTLEEALPPRAGVDGFFAVDSAAFLRAQDVTRRFALLPAAADTGRRFRYNNLDFIVAAAIIERVTGRPFASVLRTELLQPLGLTSTGLLGADRPRAPLVPAWDSTAAGVRRVDGWRLANYGAAGAMYSTADDLQRWDAALLSFRVLGEAATRRLFAVVPGTGFVTLGSFAYRPQGFGDAPPEFVDREGAIGAYQMEKVLIPEKGYSVIVLSNSAQAEIFAPFEGKGMMLALLTALGRDW